MSWVSLVYEKKRSFGDWELVVFGLKARGLKISADEEKENLKIPISCEEISQGLKDLPNNKAPGGDGISANFYKFFGQKFKILYVKVYCIV